LLFKGNHERILNCDEMAWKILSNDLLTYPQLGADSVSVGAMLSDKDATTALGTITSSREKLLLYLVGKDRSARAESSQLGPHRGHQSDHSPSGWMTTTFTTNLHWLRRQHSDTAPVNLVPDLCQFTAVKRAEYTPLSWGLCSTLSRQGGLMSFSCLTVMFSGAQINLPRAFCLSLYGGRKCCCP
jgi:hypothetical protein